jgi:hypothetical protein
MVCLRNISIDTLHKGDTEDDDDDDDDNDDNNNNNNNNMDLIYPQKWQHCLFMLKLLSTFRISLQRLLEFQNFQSAYTENRSFTHNKMVRKSQYNKQLGKRKSKLARRYNSKMQLCGIVTDKNNLILDLIGGKYSNDHFCSQMALTAKVPLLCPESH